VTLTGSGAVLLSNSAGNVIHDPFAGTGLLVNVNNTIAGAGNIGNGQMALDNQASGTINADLSTPLILQPNGNGFTNEGTMEATNGGALELLAGSFTQSGAMLLTGSSSTVSLSKSTVTGGTLTLGNGGMVVAAGGTNDSLQNVTISDDGSGRLQIRRQRDLELGNGVSDAINFAGANGKLRLDSAETAAFPGLIAKFAAGGILELGKWLQPPQRRPPNGSNTILNVALSDGNTLTYNLAGAYTADTFSVTPANGGVDSDIAISGTSLLAQFAASQFPATSNGIGSTGVTATSLLFDTALALPQHY
jgi:hypothetical protein